MISYALLLLGGLVQMGSCQTMDQLISSAAETSQQMDILHDENTVLVELDMLFSKEDWDEIQRLNGRLQKRTAVRSLLRRWTNKTVPYTIASGFNEYDTQQVVAAIKDWNKYTCLNFQPANRTDRNRVEFVNGRGCSSFVGMVGGPQAVTLAPGCRKKGIIIHELGHAIGFYHEHMRPDRDNYVTIIHRNINPKALGNFEKHSSRIINNYNVTYDYESVMHYGKYYFSRNRKITIVTKDPKKQDLIGNRYGHSFRDIKMANIMYSCSRHCTNDITCPGEGFVGKDCTCWCPGYPYKKCSEVTKGGGEAEECEDNYNSCATWAARGECSKYPILMSSSCKRSCKKCEVPTQTDCTDSTRYCVSWSGRGYCRTWTYMKRFCKKSCGLCTAPATTTTTITTTPAPTTTESPAVGIMGAVRRCRDNSRYCSRWVVNGNCSGNNVYLRRLCRRSCGLCRR